MFCFFLYNFSLSNRTLVLPAFWKHPEPGSSGRKCGEAPRRLHAVLQRSRLHQEARSRAGGEETRQTDRIVLMSFGLKGADCTASHYQIQPDLFLLYRWKWSAVLTSTRRCAEIATAVWWWTKRTAPLSGMKRRFTSRWENSPTPTFPGNCSPLCTSEQET